MHLERGIRPLQGNVLAGHLERFLACDPDPDRALAEPSQAAAQGAVAGRIGHDIGVEMRLAERGQDADQRYPAMVRLGRITGPGQEQAQLAGQRGERAPGQRCR
jgi:hypothetical protein